MATLIKINFESEGFVLRKCKSLLMVSYWERIWMKSTKLGSLNLFKGDKVSNLKTLHLSDCEIMPFHSKFQITLTRKAILVETIKFMNAFQFHQWIATFYQFADVKLCKLGFYHLFRIIHSINLNQILIHDLETLNSHSKCKPIPINKLLSKLGKSSTIFLEILKSYELNSRKCLDYNDTGNENINETVENLDKCGAVVPSVCHNLQISKNQLLKVTPKDKGTIIKEIEFNTNPFQVRTKLPAKTSSLENVSFLSILRNSIGKDLSDITLPIEMNEPISLLQKQCEELEYSNLLEAAAKISNDEERICLVAAFFVSTFASSLHRSARKPFNPMLGETYEYVCPNRKLRFVSEKVSHHPHPLIASHAESDTFIYFQESLLTTNVGLKTMEMVFFTNSSPTLAHVIYNSPRLTSIIHGQN
jgi:hypothetical protein